MELSLCWELSAELQPLPGSSETPNIPPKTPFLAPHGNKPQPSALPQAAVSQHKTSTDTPPHTLRAHRNRQTGFQHFKLQQPGINASPADLRAVQERSDTDLHHAQFKSEVFVATSAPA